MINGIYLRKTYEWKVEIGQLEDLTSIKTKGETSLFQRNTVDLNMKM